LVIDATEGKVDRAITDSGFNEPYALTYSDDGKEVWVVNKQVDGSNSGSITIISVSDYSVTITLNDENLSTPEGISIADGKAYVANRGNGTISVFDLQTRDFLKGIDVGGEPRYVVSAIDGKFVYVTGVNYGLVKISTSLDSVVNKISAYGRNAAIAPDGSKLFVASHGSSIYSVDTKQM